MSQGLRLRMSIDGGVHDPPGGAPSSTSGDAMQVSVSPGHSSDNMSNQPSPSEGGGNPTSQCQPTPFWGQQYGGGAGTSGGGKLGRRQRDSRDELRSGFGTVVPGGAVLRGIAHRRTFLA